MDKKDIILSCYKEINESKNKTKTIDEIVERLKKFTYKETGKRVSTVFVIEVLKGIFDQKPSQKIVLFEQDSRNHWDYIAKMIKKLENEKDCKGVK